LRPAAVGPDGGDHRRASGREKHTQKITVYLSAEELLDLERARLALLRYGVAAATLASDHPGHDNRARPLGPGSANGRADVSGR
jgi:hypothetical protein